MPSIFRRSTGSSLLFVALGLAACEDDGDPTGGGGANAGGTAADGGGAASAGGAPAGGAGQGGVNTSSMGGSGGEDPWEPLVSLKEIDLGESEIGDTQYFSLPDRMLGFTTLSEASSSLGMGIASLKPPTQSSVIYNFEIPGTGLDYFVDIGALNGGTPLSDLPQAYPAVEGLWSLRLAAEEGLTTARSRVYVRRTLDGQFHGGALDIHVGIAPGSGVGQAYVSGVIDSLFASYYGPLVGLSKGNVTFSTIGSQYDFIDGQNEYRQLLASSSTAASAPAVNLFVVGGFGGEIDNALGVAGGIPGTAMVHGTTRSGVAYTPTGDQGYDASVLAHEIGHLGGLFHTSEYQVSAFDPLSDTAQCPNIQNTNPENCPDVTNVMFPIAYGGYQLSTTQARVLQGSALYRGVLEEGGQPAAPLLPVQSRDNASLLEPTGYALPAVSAPPVAAIADRLERTLHGHWCGTMGSIESAVARAITSDDRVTLRALTVDGHTFDVARGRALSLLWKSASSSEDVEDLVEIALAILRDDRAGRRSKLAAVDALDAWAPAKLARALEAETLLVDPILTARAQILGYLPL